MSTLTHHPSSNKLQELCSAVLGQCDVRIDGDRPWDVVVREDRVYESAARGDLLELGRSFVRGDWDCQDVSELVARLANTQIKLPGWAWPTIARAWVKNLFSDGGSRRMAKEVGKRHYDLSQELFEAMLDKRMVYSCAYWANAKTLEEAQENKLDLLCKKLNLKPGMRLLDIGCGWGGLVKYAAENYGVSCVGLTISKDQYDYATRICKDLPITIKLEDYRDMEGSFDRVVSVGMFEHVGRKHYNQYMDLVRNHLSDDGIFVLHCIGTADRGAEDNPWITHDIFPGGHIPAMLEVAESIEGRFVVEDWHNFGADYDRTLMEWFKRFDRSWSKLQDNPDPNFYNRWKLYLLGCAGAFRARSMQLWQIVLSPQGVAGGYRSVR